MALILSLKPTKLGYLRTRSGKTGVILSWRICKAKPCIQGTPKGETKARHQVNGFEVWVNMVEKLMHDALIQIAIAQHMID